MRHYNIEHIKSLNEILKEIELVGKYKRIFNFVFNQKERDKIIKELYYFSNIHYDTSPTILINCLINKSLKIKLHHIQFMDIKEDMNEYLEYRHKILYDY